jgi:hypothetical protein
MSASNISPSSRRLSPGHMVQLIYDCEMIPALAADKWVPGTSPGMTVIIVGLAGAMA